MSNLQAFLNYIIEAIRELFRIIRWDLGLAPKSHYALVA